MPRHAWPATLTVVMPTVPCRTAMLDGTLARLYALGASPFVHQQDPSWPIGHASHTRHVSWLIQQAATNTDASHILLTEDDIDIDPATPRLLPALMDDRVWSLWAPGLVFYPTDLKTLLRQGKPLPSRMSLPAKPLRQWHGTLAILGPRATLADIAASPSKGIGWDVHLRACLAERGENLWLPIPNLVEHRGTISAVSPRGTSGLARSATFGWPVTGERDDG